MEVFPFGIVVGGSGICMSSSVAMVLHAYNVVIVETEGYAFAKSPIAISRHVSLGNSILVLTCPLIQLAFIISKAVPSIPLQLPPRPCDHT